jgi:hypothetical protein
MVGMLFHTDTASGKPEMSFQMIQPALLFVYSIHTLTGCNADDSGRRPNLLAVIASLVQNSSKGARAEKASNASYII